MINIDKEFVELCDILVSNGAKVYLVGGAVRDIVMYGLGLVDTLSIGDLDIATDLLPEEVTKIIECYNHMDVDEVGAKFLVNIVSVGDKQYEVATFRKEAEYDGRRPGKVERARNLKEDLARRDFTMNALAISYEHFHLLESNDFDAIIDSVVDIFNGINDIKNMIINTVNDPDERFEQDYLRMLRCVRFASKYGFNISEETMKSIKKNANLINGSYKSDGTCIKKPISRDRIFDEIFKMLKTKNPSRGIRLMSELNILEYVMPNISNMVKFEQGGIHHHDLFEHTMRTLDALRDDDTIALLKDNNLSPFLEIAALYHDVGKTRDGIKEVKKIRGIARPTFYEHEKVGASMIMDIFKASSLDKKKIGIISSLIKHHMYFVDKNTHRKGPLRKLLRKLSDKHGEFGEIIMRGLIALHHADVRGCDGTTSKNTTKISDTLDDIIIESGKEPLKLDKVDGHVIIDWFTQFDIKDEYDVGEDGNIGVMVGKSKSYLLSKIDEDISLNEYDILKGLFVAKFCKSGRRIKTSV